MRGPTNPDPSLRKPAAKSGAALILIPVTAEDFARGKRRIIAICVASALTIGGIGFWMYQRAMNPIRAQESYDSGVKLLTIARYQQAILSFDRATALQRNFADAYRMRGRALVGEARPDRAIADFSEYVTLRPDDPHGFIDRAAAYLAMKDDSSAAADASSAIRLNPKLAVAYNTRGTAERAMGDPQKALEDFNRAVELAPVASNFYERGATYHLLGDYRKAIADFDQVIAFNPTSAVGYFARAQSLASLGDLKGAEEDRTRGRMRDTR